MRTPTGLLYPHAITALCAALLFGACGGGDVSLPPDGQPASLSVVHGDEQTGRVGDPLAEPLVIEVLDSRGEPVEGVTVAFEFSSAGTGAAVVPAQKTTNSAGQADARLVLGTTVGPQTGQVRVVEPAGSESVQASFSAMALSENANSMVAAGGQDQTGHVLRPLDDRLVVEVTDGFGNPVAGVPITWLAEGGGSVSETSVATDEDGRSRVDRILGPTVGQQTTVASSEGLAGSPVVFVHTAIAGDASRLTIISGDAQTGAVGAVLPAELVVRLVDSEGNGVPNTALTWVPAIGGGSPNPQNSTTDADGYSSTGWTLGPALGDQRMDAVVSGVGVVSFTATATAGAPSALFIRTQPSSSARNGVPFDRQPVVQLRDPQGNDVAAAGVLVTVTLNGGGELEGTTRQITDASGGATFTDLAISGEPGARTLTFEAVGYASVTSDPITVAAIGTTTTITSDLPDPSQVGTPFTVSFRVASDGPTPTGNVIVGDGVDSCTGALSNGAGTCQLSLSTVGARTITASYAGLPGLTGSSDTEPHSVTAAPPPPPAATSTTITADSPDPSASGSDVTVAVRVTSSAGTPTGNVIITVSGGVGTCTATLSGGEGSCQVRLDNVGERTFTATYAGAPGFAGSSDTESHTVTAQPPPPPAATTTTITGDSPDPSAAGESVLVSFTVASSSGTPTGSVTVSDGSASCSGTLSGGSGSCQLTLSTVGSRTLTATYSGSDGFGGSSDTESHTVTGAPPPPPASTSTTITSDSPDPSENGATVVVGFQVTSSGGTPSGSVTVTFSTGNGSCTGTLSGGTGSCELTLNGVGQGTLTATYSGAPGFSPSSDEEGHTVTAQPPPPPASTTTTITGDTPDPSDPGQAITVSYTVSSSGGTPSGTVTVSDANGGGCSGDAPSGSCTYTPSGTGSRTITATYGGSSGFEGSSDTEEHTVTTPPPPPASTTTTITGDTPDPSDPGQEITVSFAVSSSGGTPTGTVTVSDGVGGTCIGSAPSGSCSYTPSGTGSRTITATYEGNSSFGGSSGTAEHTVTTPPASTSTTITGDTPDPSDPGVEITVSFTVSSSSGSPTGNVLVTDGVGGGCSGSAPSGSCSYVPSGTGTRTITAAYEGNSSFTGSSATEEHSVVTPNQQPAAAFEFDCNDLECDFQSRSSDNDGRIVNYSWAFGDGESSGDGDDDQPEHFYDAPGIYQVTLTVTDDDGATGSITQAVEVTQAAVNRAPVASIGSITCTGMNCGFTDDSTDPDGADTIASYRWVFGDEATSGEQNPSYAYTVPGDYPAILTVIDDGGLSSSDQDTVHVASGDGQGNLPSLAPSPPSGIESPSRTHRAISSVG